MANRTSNVAGTQAVQVTSAAAVSRRSTLSGGTSLAEKVVSYVPPAGLGKPILVGKARRAALRARPARRECRPSIVALLPLVPAEHFIADPTGKINQLRLRTTQRSRTVGLGAFLSRTRMVSRTHAFGGVQGVAGEKYHDYEDITLPLTLAAQGDYPLTYRSDPDITDPNRSKQWMIHLGEDP
jgi:hypothetical protein